MNSTKITPGISVIICCYNSSERIEKVLEHLKKQKNTNGFPWEVVVVDNASKDDTAKVAERSWNKNEVDFKVVYEGKPGLSNARIRGIHASRYSIIVFVDDDNWVSDNYISRAWQIMKEHSDVGLAGGLGIPVAEKELPSWFNHYQDAFAVGKQYDNEGYLPASRTYLHGAGIIMRKKVWNILHEKEFQFLLSGRTGKSLSSGEDSEISAAFRLAGYKLWYDPLLVFKHIIPDQRLRWEYIMKLAREFGKTFVILSLYTSVLNDTKGRKRLKTHNWSIGLADNLFQMIKMLPAYLRLKVNYSEGVRKEFEFNYQMGALSERIKILHRFRSVKNEISDLQERLKV